MSLNYIYDLGDQSCIMWLSLIFRKTILWSLDCTCPKAGNKHASQSWHNKTTRIQLFVEHTN